MSLKKTLASTCAGLALVAVGAFAMEAIAHATTPTVDTFNLYTKYSSTLVNVPPATTPPTTTFTTASVLCDEGDYATGGGYSTGINGDPSQYQTSQNHMEMTGGNTPVGWTVTRTTNDPLAGGSIQAWVICMDVLS